MHLARHWWRPILRWLGIGIGLLLLVGILLALVPVDTSQLTPDPDVAQTHTEAVARIADLQASDTAAINPVCRTRLLTHTMKVTRTVVLLHGLTACPHQFTQLGEQLFARGYNVLIPRLPRHGAADRLTPELAQLTAAELAALADESIDIAHGLGDHLTVVGFSAGGVLAAWATQYRAEIDRSVLISPAFSTGDIPKTLATPAMRLLVRFPNQFRWKDATRQEGWPGPAHAYPWVSTRSFGEVMRLGSVVLTAAHTAPPASRQIVVITNGADTLVDNALTTDLIAAWQRYPTVALDTYTFPADLDLIHDIIDPAQPDQQTDLIYPVLLAYIADESRP